MKTLKILFLLICAFLLWSCSSEEDNEVVVCPVEYYATPEQTEYSVSAAGGMLSIPLATNIELDSLHILARYSPNSAPGEWLSANLSYDIATNGNYKFLLSVAANTEQSERKAYIYIIRGTNTENVKNAYATITVTQEAATDTLTESPLDGIVDTLQMHTEGNGIPIVIMGDGFTEEEIADSTYDQVMRKAMDNLFTEEPMATLQAYFDIYSVTAVSEDNRFGNAYSTVFSCKLYGNDPLVEGDDDKVKIYAQKVENIDIDKALVVVILNTEEYAGTTYFSASAEGDYLDYAVSYCPTIYGLDSEMFRTVLIHEAVGHGLAKLADEYSYEDEGAIPAREQANVEELQDRWGWFTNIDFTSDSTEVLWSEFLFDDRYESQGLGVYEGAYGYITGAYRPSDESMMNANNCAFNAPSRKKIYDRIMEDGAGLTPTYEDFVAFDMATYTPSMLATAKRLGSATTTDKHFHRPLFRK